MGVLVTGLTGRPLMPTTNCKARKLIKNNKAVIVRRHPFTIQLLYRTGSVTQAGHIGEDTGSQNIGISVTVGNKVIIKDEHILRSSMEKRQLMETRKEYRRGRRYRKTPYRHPKWKHKTVRRYNSVPDRKGRHWQKVDSSYESQRPEGWLPPSLQSKVDHHVRITKRYMETLPKSITKDLVIEVGRFDMARMKDPSVHGELYQRGPQYGYENVKAYVLDRDGYKCKVCGMKGGSKRKDGSVVKLHVHHVLFKSKGATDNPDYMACVCTECHSEANHKPGGILYEWMIKKKKFARGYRDATTMNVLRRRMHAAFPDAKFTYGSITAADRERLHLMKSHGNDAVAIALRDTDYTDVKNTDVATYRQVRKGKRSLHEANPRKGRKEPNRTAKRNSKNTVSVKGFHLWDTVEVNGKTGYISGFAGTSAYIKDTDDNYIIPEGKNYKQWSLSEVRRIHPNGGWLVS